MSVILSCQSLSKSYSTKPLFEKLSFGLFDGDRIGIIGPNGTGKSTLMKILAGIEQADGGDLSSRKFAKITYVPQVISYPSERSVLDITREAARTLNIPEDEIEVECSIVLTRAGFEDFDIKVGQLSGGWKKRLTISCSLMGEPDLILLDEPTNHLDIQGILWLESILQNAKFAWTMITHDRYLLEKIATRIIEVNKVYPEGLLSIEGTYSNFLARRAEFYKNQSKLEDSLANKVKREIDWLRTGPKARTSKSKYRIDEAHSLIDDLSSLRSRMKTSKTKIDFSSSGRKTKRLVVLNEISKAIGDKKILSDFDLVLTPQINLGLLGANGSGKTTLLKLINEELVPDSGDIFHADFLNIVYFDQNREKLNPNHTLKQALSDTGNSVIFQGKEVHVASWAKRFGFRPDQLDVELSMLSGGEQARIAIANLMLQPADVLLLDEPTNDLDIQTLEVLEENLAEFPGALVLVTHDRYILERVCNVYAGLDGEGECKLYGSYEQWETLIKKEGSPRKKAAPKQANKTENKSSGRLSYMEQREFDSIEAKILEEEERLDTARKSAEDPSLATNAEKLKELADVMEKAQEEIDRLYSRWSELEAKIT